jgi:hypothetical protein
MSGRPNPEFLRSVMQLLGDEARASFAAWCASPNKIEY